MRVRVTVRNVLVKLLDRLKIFSLRANGGFDSEAWVSRSCTQLV